MTEQAFGFHSFILIDRQNNYFKFLPLKTDPFKTKSLSSERVQPRLVLRTWRLGGAYRAAARGEPAPGRPFGSHPGRDA